jgi:CRISPR-associated endonuclease Csy4
LDFIVQGNQEVNVHHAMGALYTRLHRALVAQRQARIGVSFPKQASTGVSIGNTLRLHGTEADLNTLMAAGWHRAMADLVEARPIATVPPYAVPQVVRRVQPKSNVERLMRRAMKRKSLSEAAARAAYATAKGQTSELPYVQLVSASTGEHFRLFVLQEAVSTPRVGEFSAYGLSSGAIDGPTVPRF